MDTKKLQQRFCEIFQSTKQEGNLFFSPGRINLIGEHTDYNGGYVLPCALDFGTYLIIRRNGENSHRFASLNFKETFEIPTDANWKKENNHWVNYPLGVLNEIRQIKAFTDGFDFLFSGNIPHGAGLSSSASIETVTAIALNELLKLNLSKWEIIKLAQRAENQFVGVNCGIMDQFAVTMGAPDTALFLNCSTLEYQAVAFMLHPYRILIMNTNKPRRLADSKYNERRGECEQAVKWIQAHYPIKNLSDLNPQSFKANQKHLSDPLILKRARHIITENQRVLEALDALKENKLSIFGQLMNQSHNSLRDDYSVTGKELDALVDAARQQSGVLGARMTGAGFGGCAIALVHQDHTQKFINNVSKIYHQKTGLTTDFYSAVIGPGAGRINPDLNTNA